MAKRRISSVLRDNFIHDLYDEELKMLGEIGCYVSKSYIYEKISKKTGLSTRSISFILNHTVKKEVGR